MKKLTTFALAGALTLSIGVTTADAQDIPVMKDYRSSVSTTTTTSGGDIDWTGPLGYTLRPGTAPIYCSPADEAERDVALALTRTVPGLVDVRFARGGAV